MWDRDSAVWLVGSKLAMTCHLRLPSGKSLTRTFICLCSALPNRKSRNTSIRCVREDWKTACRRCMKNIHREEGVTWDTCPNSRLSGWINRRYPCWWDRHIQPKHLGWTYCVINLLVSWREVVFAVVGKSLMYLAVVVGTSWPSLPSTSNLQNLPWGLWFLTLFRGGLVSLLGVEDLFSSV